MVKGKIAPECGQTVSEDEKPRYGGMTAEERWALDDEAYFASLDEDDSPEWTEEMFARARPGHEVLPPDVLENLKRPGRPKQQKTKTLVSLRLDPDVLAHFQEEGEGWRGRIEDALKKEMKRRKRK